MHEIKDWKKKGRQNVLTPETLMRILKGIYPEDVAEELYEELSNESEQRDRTQERTS